MHATNAAGAEGGGGSKCSGEKQVLCKGVDEKGGSSTVGAARWMRVMEDEIGVHKGTSIT